MIPDLALSAPALHWTDGHVLGNGDVGAVVWGTAERLCVGFSKHDVNDLRCPPPRGGRPRMTYPEARDRVMQGERDIPKLTAQANPGPRSGQQQLACGRLVIELLREVQPIGFSQTLSLAEAEVRVTARPTTAGYTFGMTYHPITARVLVLAGRNVALVELASEGRQQVRWHFDRSADPERPRPAFGLAAAGSTTAAVMTHLLPENTAYAVAIAAAGDAPLDAAAGPHGLTGTLRFGGDGGSLVLAVGLASNYEAGDGDVAECAARLVTGLGAAEVQKWQESHRAWWTDFWSASSIAYDNPAIERLWYAGLYALGASTRPHTSPPNLQGLWGQDDVSPWHADFHFNTNVQECQWGACSANHPELQAALIRVLTEDWREELDLTGREMYGIDAPAVNLAVDWRGRAIGVWGFLELSVTAWTAQHVWEHYLHTQDRDLLRDRAYPFLRACARGYLELLVEDAAGQLNIELSHSPEQVWFDGNGRRYHAHGRNPCIDISCLGTLFAAVVQAAELLGDEDGIVADCRHALAHLPPFPTADGVLIDYETGFFHDGDRPGRFPHCHRHPSRLMPVFPGRQIGLHSDSELLELGRRSFREFRSYGEAGFTGWSYSYQACIAARLGLGEEAEDCLQTLFDGYVFDGMLTSHNSFVPGVGNHEQYGGSPLFQIDALLGSMAAVNEMLVQRQPDGVIRVFPAVPAGRSASFQSLRVPGAVLVSAARNRDGVEWIAVRAECAGEVAVALPWRGATIVPQPPDLRLDAAGPSVRWTAAAGTLYRLTPTAG